MNSVRLGILRLVDSAPAVVAADRKMFATEDVSVTLSVELSWQTLLDKLQAGKLDAAIALPPLILAAMAATPEASSRMIVPMGISLGGNTVVISGAAAAWVMPENGFTPMAQLFAEWVRSAPRRPRFAIVHPLSTHNLLFRLWLGGVGLNPDRDFVLSIIPPDKVVEALSADEIDGFCAGAPWGVVAEMHGVGRILLGSSSIWVDHPEKCLAINESWAISNPAPVRGMLRALLEAGRFCDAPENSALLASLLASPSGLNLTEEACLAALPGGTGHERIRFHTQGAWYPRVDHARWFLREMQRWGFIPSFIDPHEVAGEVYRPDLLVLATDGQMGDTGTFAG